MCGRFTLITDGSDLADAFGVTELATLTPRYNIAPTQAIAALVGDPAALSLRRLHWGLVPAWAKDRKMGARMINARAETVAEKPSFRAAFAARRCLIPADGYYEWVKTGSRKQAWYITRKDNRPFAFAGLWERWTPADAPALESCTIITTAADPGLSELHHRMPVVLERDDYARWLAPRTDRAALLQLIEPPQSCRFDALAVGSYVNAAAHEGPECIQPSA